jgi:hypothetical protein
MMVAVVHQRYAAVGLIPAVGDDARHGGAGADALGAAADGAAADGAAADGAAADGAAADGAAAEGRGGGVTRRRRDAAAA